MAVQTRFPSRLATTLTHHASRITLLTLTLSTTLASAATIDESKLPPSANTKIEFTRDIQPIFEKTCWRCHGPERPKSHFRLDNRESALKGGDNGIDIISGNSAKSPLIHYVSRLVPDMEMPPPGKGEPLTPEQIGLLRAWIDQGVTWGGTNPPVQLAFSATPMFRYVNVEGDKKKFREIEGYKEGFGGGLENFSLQEQLGPDKKLTIEGRALAPDKDFRLKLGLDKADLGFIHAGFEQWRRYYDDTGGFYRPFAIPSFDLNRDLHLDLGRAWIDFGLNLPNWPLIVVGYEYQYKEGTKSMLEWGNVGGKNIYPAWKDIDEHVHIAKLDVTKDLGEWRIEDRARVEIYSLNTRQDDSATFNLGPGPDSFVRTHQDTTYVQGMNTLRVERPVKDWGLFTGGYLYSRYDGDNSFDQTTITSAGVPTQGQFWSSDVLTLKREAQVGSLGTLITPAEGLSLSGGVQGEWNHQEGAGRINLDSGNPDVPSAFTLLPATVQSDLDDTKVNENLGLRFTKIPFTVLFAEGRFEQDYIGQYEHEYSTAGSAGTLGRDAFLRDTDANNQQREGRIGFNTSPWRWFTLSAEYKDRISETDYDKHVDFTYGTNGLLIPNPGYSAFIRHRKIDSTGVQTKLVVKPVTWLKATFTYRLAGTDYTTGTDVVTNGTVPEALLAGRYDAHIYGFNLTVTPFQRLYFSGTFSYTSSRTTTAAHNTPSIAPYRGDEYSLLTSADFALDQVTHLHATYFFSRADYGQDNVADGLPLGLDYSRHALMAGISRRLSSRVSANLRYAFYQYQEPSTGGFNDYSAHGVFASMTFKWN
jgi:hypothetical protein